MCRPRRCRPEVAAYIEQFADVRGKDGRRMVVRNGTAEPRTVLTSAGAGDFVPALGRFLGSHAGLSSSTVTRLTGEWQAEAAAFMARDLSAPPRRACPGSFPSSPVILAAALGNLAP